jgi:prevent-host-death family protein
MAITTISSTDFRRRPGQVRRAAEEAGAVTITERGRPAYVLVSFAEYLRMLRSTTARVLAKAAGVTRSSA